MTDDRLAIEGGKPIADEEIPFHEPDLGQSEVESVESTLDSGWVVGPGPKCETVEERLRERWSVPDVLTTTSGTHALEMALLALDLEPDDEVIVPSYTYVSTALAVLRAGATPVFADVDDTTLTLTAESTQAALSSQTRAIIYVHYGGYPGAMKPIQELCSQQNLDLIEDAAQAFDSHRNGQPAGTFGRFAAFSFHGTKPITSGEGGALVVNNPDDHLTCEMIRDKGTDRSRYLRGDVDRYTWRSIGSSYVLSDIQGAVLKTQLERWPEIRSERLAVQQRLRSTLESVDTKDSWDVVQPGPEEKIDENGHLTAFLVRNAGKAGEVLDALQGEGIEARSHYQPLHESPYARTELNVTKSLPVSERIADQLIRLPTHTQLSVEQLNQIEAALRKVYREVMVE